MSHEAYENATARDLGLIREIAQTFRRVFRAEEAFDFQGVRTIWHRGKQKTEMLTWENRENKILRQELSIMGAVLEYREGARLRTATIPLQDSISQGAGEPTQALVEFDANPSLITLVCAAYLVKHMKERDYYCQHLLKHVNEAIAMSEFENTPTAVTRISNFRRTHPSILLDRLERHLKRRRTLFLVGVAAVAVLATLLLA